MNNQLPEELKNRNNRSIVQLAAGEIEQLIRDDIIKELKEYHNEQMNMVLLHPKVYKHLTKKSHKKIKRRLYYDVWYWSKNGDFVTRVSKYFESAKKAKKYVNHIHNFNLIQEYDYVRMEKTWCYREFTPKHKWYYYSWKPNQFICVERY